MCVHACVCVINLLDFFLAGLIRSHAEAERLFVANNGLSHLLRALEMNIPKLTTKIIFLLSNLIENKNEHIGMCAV